MSTHAPTTTLDALREGEARAREASTPYETAQAEYRRRLQIAEDCEAEIASVEGKRDPLLSKAFSGDVQAEALLAQLEPHTAALRQRARDARDAAALLKPHLDALATEGQRAARVVMELRHRLTDEARERTAQAYRDAIASVWPCVEAYVRAAAAAEQSHRQTFGEASRHEAPAFCAARLLGIEARRFFGVEQYQALGHVFPETAGQL